MIIFGTTNASHYVLRDIRTLTLMIWNRNSDSISYTQRLSCSAIYLSMMYNSTTIYLFLYAPYNEMSEVDLEVF